MRKKLLLASAIPALAVLSFLVSSPRVRTEKIFRWRIAGIIPVEIKVYDTSATVERVLDGCREQLKALEVLFNRYRSDSEISRINRNAPNKPVAVSADTILLLKSAMELSEQTGGAFDITVVPLITLWKNAEKEDKIPNTDTIQKILAHTGSHHIILDKEKQTVVFTDRNVQIDLGGISKGYMVDSLVSLLKAGNIQRGLVNVGGDLRVFGGSPEDPFIVGIKDPETPSRIIRTLRLTDAAVATSGNYERYTTIQGRKYSHIIDPRNGMPADHCPSVTVIAQDAVRADAYATAFSVLGPDASKERSAAEPDVDFFMGQRDNGNLHWTLSEGMNTYMQNE